jgi:redox-sensitive bicupin YhaK (pirin superfamily)
MKKIIYPAAQRGFQDHGWLKAAHSFSFAGYYDPAKVHFGLLRVLNDDIVAPSKGFGLHPHDNMEIVTIPLRGSLAHKDSLGSEGTITAGEVQIMSAGSGIRHSEFNGSATEAVNLLQIWVFPKERNIQPRYDQKRFDKGSSNDFKILVSPEKAADTLWINQDAWFSIGNFDKDTDLSYSIKHPGNGLYLFVIEGRVEIDGGNRLEKRDAAGFFDTATVRLMISKGSKVLAIDVPME